MYTHCLFCRGDLGLNQEVEHFQVGRIHDIILLQNKLVLGDKLLNRFDDVQIQQRAEDTFEIRPG